MAWYIPRWQNMQGALLSDTAVKMVIRGEERIVENDGKELGG